MQDFFHQQYVSFRECTFPGITFPPFKWEPPTTAAPCCTNHQAWRIARDLGETSSSLRPDKGGREDEMEGWRKLIGRKNLRVVWVCFFVCDLLRIVPSLRITGPCQKEGFGCVFLQSLLDLQTTSDLRSRLILRDGKLPLYHHLGEYFVSCSKHF